VQDIEQAIDLVGLGHGGDCAFDWIDEGIEFPAPSQRRSEDFD
jgi:hypothetical protein